jgi:hypothetical protein
MEIQYSQLKINHLSNTPSTKAARGGIFSGVFTQGHQVTTQGQEDFELSWYLFFQHIYPRIRDGVWCGGISCNGDRCSSHAASLHLFCPSCVRHDVVWICDRIHVVASASLWTNCCQTLQHMLILNSLYPCQHPSLLANMTLMTLNQQLSVLCLFLVLVHF